MFAPVFNAILPVVAVMLVGLLWARSGRLLDPGALTPLLTAVGTPCLVFSTLSRASIPASAFTETALASDARRRVGSTARPII